MLSRMEAGLSGTTFLDPSEVLLLGEHTLQLGFSVRTECKFFFEWVSIHVEKILEIQIVRHGQMNKMSSLVDGRSRIESINERMKINSQCLLRTCS